MLCLHAEETTWSELRIYRGVDNGAAGAAAAAPIIWLVVVIQKWRAVCRPKTFFSLLLWMQFELILAWQITSRSRDHGPMIFMPQMLNFLFFFARFARYFILNTIKKGMRLKPPKNTITYNITVNTLNDFTVEPLKTSFA